ncbi:Uncharacterized protein GNX_3351 [Leptospira interrogans serovar Canicola]|nr:Uncharacterized protein GNX_3351 [Leptospira interrogans serovar Canicola]
MKIDGYEIKDRMNTDSSTEVYKAVRSKDKTEVVVKYIPILDELHPAVVNLRNEYEILSYLSSEKMIRAFGMEKIPEGFILILEFVPGQSLKHFSQKRPVNLKDFFKIAIDLAEKLGEIHNKKSNTQRSKTGQHHIQSGRKHFKNRGLWNFYTAFQRRKFLVQSKSFRR